jgi:hypothetical protein
MSFDALRRETGVRVPQCSGMSVSGPSRFADRAPAYRYRIATQIVATMTIAAPVLGTISARFAAATP